MTLDRIKASKDVQAYALSHPLPAYTADRGPVSVFSGRFHGEF